MSRSCKALTRAFLATIVLAGCDSTGSNGSGHVSLLLTDAPGDVVAAVVTISAVHLQGDHGNVVVRLNAKTLKVCWSYSNLKLTPLGTASATPTASHIHIGAAGVSGGAILVPFGGAFARSGCTTTAKANIDAIVANPSGYYVNVHNASYPAGAIRGQLKKGAPA